MMEEHNNGKQYYYNFTFICNSVFIDDEQDAGDNNDGKIFSAIFWLLIIYI